ncbi:hypothetical protein ScPMuIL_003057 [Solemya velum]
MPTKCIAEDISTTNESDDSGVVQFGRLSSDHADPFTMLPMMCYIIVYRGRFVISVINPDCVTSVRGNEYKPKTHRPSGITAAVVRPRPPVSSVMLDGTSIPVDTGDSFTYKTVWTSTERRLKGIYNITITNGADMAEVGTLEVTECADFYFDDCSKACTCVREHSTSCDDVTGRCTCKTGWIGTDCGQDKNECDDPNACPKENDHCYNLDGTFECVCNLGYHTVDAECKKCDSMKYGADCAYDCTCVPENTKECDNEFGTCDCKDGWTGQNCEIDPNE